MRLLGQLKPEHQSPLQWSSALERAEQDRTRSGTKWQQVEILYFRCSTGLAFQSKASCRFSLSVLVQQLERASAFQSYWERETLIPFLHCQLLYVLVSFSPTGQQPTGSAPLLWEKQDADAQVSVFPVSMFVGTCLLCVYTCPCMLLACHLGRRLKYLASCLSPFLKAAVTWPRESLTAADSQGWDIPSLCRHCCAALQKFGTVGGSKSQPDVLFHTWLAWGREPREELRAILGLHVQPNCSLSCNLPHLTTDHIPISHVSGQQLLVSILLLGRNTITSLERDTAAVSKGKRTALVPMGCMLPLSSVLWFVRVFWFCCCGLSFWSQSF